MRRVVAVLGTALVLLVASAGPAGAHAVLEATEPASGARLDRLPEQVVLRFSEPVEVAIGAVRVYDESGERVDSGKVSRVEGGRAVAADLPELDRGAYVVTWRVVSADSHPIHGAFTFRVGPAGAGDDQALVRRLLAAEGGSTAVGAVYAVVRFVAFASLLLLLGGAVFLVALWPEGGASPRLRRGLWAAWAGALVTTVLGIGLQGAYAAGLGLADAARSSVLSAVLDTRFGKVWAARAVLLLVGAVVLRALIAQPRGRAPMTAGALLGAAVLVTPGWAGHAGAAHPAWLLVAVDAMHLGAAAVWLGGAAVLAGCLLGAGEDTLDRVVPRYARVAFIAVVVIAGTGTIQGWRQVGSLDALTSTTYGRLLMLKVGLFAGVVALASLSRAWVRRRYWRPAPALVPGPGAATAGAESPQAPSRLRRLVLAELGIAVGVLAVTALLVNAVPARSALAQPFSAELEAGPVLVELTIDPAKAGPAVVHIYTFDAQTGAVRDVEELVVQLRLPARDIGPLTVPLQVGGPGHWVAFDVDLPVRGEWQLDVVVRTSDVDQHRARATFTVR